MKAETRAPRSEIRWAMLASALVVLIGSLPYAVVALTTPADLRFGGALVNAIDGQSYFAKMRQGYDGAWLFRLPFTANDEPDALLFTFQLALGHVARISGASLVEVYHAARVLGGWALLVTLYAFVTRVFDSVAERRRAWLFVALTAGLGWLAPGATDLQVPESNTFYSLLANAHFALSMALMLIAFMAVLDGSAWRAAAASLALAVLQPFAPLAVFAALLATGVVVWLARRRGATMRRQVIAASVAGLCLAPLMIYFYLATQRDPVLQGWTAQNLTPSPAPIDFVLGYGVMGGLSILGARMALKRGRDVDVLLVVWAATSLVLLYAPIALQRRFSLGLHIPIALLGVMAFPSASGRFVARWLPRLAFLVSVPTTLVLLLALSSAGLRPPDPLLFFSTDEAAAFDWLRTNAPHDAVVVAAPETALFLPAWGDVRVLYGHPFETIDAAKMKRTVEDFLAGKVDRKSVIEAYGVDYILFGPREAMLGRPEAGWQAVFASGDVTIYQAP